MRGNDQKTWIEISKSALKKNLRTITSHVKPSGVMAVIKSNAYGHGLIEVAKTIASKVPYLVVDSIDEATLIRKAGIRTPILIIGYIPPSRLIEIPKLKQVSFVAYHFTTLDQIKKIKAKPGQFHIHLKIETGTTRQGLDGSELIKFAKTAQKIPSIIIEGIYTHYADVEDTDEPKYAKLQYKRFLEEKERLERIGFHPKILHTASSAAAILHPEMRLDNIRLGIALYGYWPDMRIKSAAKRLNPALELIPALTWKTVIAQVKAVKKGTPISYGRTEKMKKDGKIAVLPVGYWDGIDRGLSSKGHVLIGGKCCKIMGRVCMNMMMVDVSALKNVKTGDEVILIGKQGSNQINADEIAKTLGTISYEVITRINPMIQRRLVA